MATLGEIRFRLTKAYPGIDPDLIDGWINDRYTQILDALPWQRLEVEAILQTTAPYRDGTVTVTAGSTAVTGASTVWTAAMSARSFRVDGRSEIYTFTRTGDATGTLDRAYEGDNAAGAAYSIFQRVYTLPADCRLLEDDAFSDFELGPLGRLSRKQLNDSAPGRPASGTPQVWASYMEDASTPPRMQIELYPIPDEARGIPYRYTKEQASLSSAATTLQAWLRPAPLIEGVSADCLNHLEKYAGADRKEARFGALVNDMKRNEAANRGGQAIRAAGWMTRHRIARQVSYSRTGPRLP